MTSQELSKRLPKESRPIFTKVGSADCTPKQKLYFEFKENCFLLCKQEEYVLPVLLTDNSYVSPLSSTGTVTISVRDENDNPPLFVSPKGLINISKYNCHPLKFCLMPHTCE